MPRSSLRRSNMNIGIALLQPLYEEEEEESEPFTGRNEEDHLPASVDSSAQSPDVEAGTTATAGGAAGLGPVGNIPPRAQRRSFVVGRRSSVESSGSLKSVNSAPPLGDHEEATTASAEAGFKVPIRPTTHRQNSLTNLFGSRVVGGRRQNNLRASFKSTGSSASGLSEDSYSSEHSSSTPSGSTSSRRASVRRGFPRLSQRRGTTRRGDGSGSLEINDLAAAVEKFNASDDWEQQTAAAAVVASRKAHSVQYSQGDRVLVLVTLLNFTIRQMQMQPSAGMDDETVKEIKDSVTLAPVNKAGFPEGEGRTDAEKAGPFSYVLCTVQQVHFDEDERYYTVIRGDTGTEQRAEAAWMEPILEEAGMQAAMRASKVTAASLADHVQGTDGNRRENAFQAWTGTFAEWLQGVYQKNRLRAKILIRKILQGDSGYGFKIRLTWINFLVLCSFIFFFLDVIALAFLSHESDYAVAVVELVVWIFLVLELVLEFLIRPQEYHAVMQSDKAFAPTTARHINTFHLVMESLALIIFAPSFRCIFDREKCGIDVIGTGIRACMDALAGNDYAASSLGRFLIGLHFLRAFGLVRHWKQVWLKNTFEDDRANSQIIRRLLLVETDEQHMKRRNRSIKKTDFEKALDRETNNKSMSKQVSEEDTRLKNAATIGTALMVINSHRYLILMLLGISLYPIISTFRYQNSCDENLGALLMAHNKAATSLDDCDYLKTAVASWLGATSSMHNEERYLFREGSREFMIWAQILPVRCPWQTRKNGVITDCEINGDSSSVCEVWEKTATISDASEEDIARILGKRPGAITHFHDEVVVTASFFGAEELIPFSVTTFYDHSSTLSFTNRGIFFLLLALLIQSFVGLTMLRGDARRLVLHPLQRMLKIVVRYAENPLSQALSGQQKSLKDENDQASDMKPAPDQLGNFETEQLINAIARIADLLRKCWGVAGAGIISSNLARTEDGKNAVFNPTVPGKRVYALFGFVAINDFGKMLRVLEQDTLVLINDVAKVVHDEVFRWALGDSGQCNKNLGGAFLMVFRIGDFREVHDRKKRATDVVFEVKQRRNVKVRRRGAGKSKGKRDYGVRQMDMGNDETLQLASLPGIQSFTDRALLGFLKSFAGLNRDYEIRKWRKDFRLGAGVGAFSVSVMYGMDAGWAVEGAVGSEYKIDATYLSPHVNMASRMMSATKQYGVTILLSQAVEKLLSTAARSKLRHLDTVKVKGSNVAQQIFTFDARHETVDFFLFERTPDQADAEAEAYTTQVWEMDQDLNAMRQHVSDEFMHKFKEGVDLYLEGKWKTAVEKLKDADDIMIETVLESGYVDFDYIDDLGQILNRNNKSEEVERARIEIGDGACKCLIHYMERRNCIPPKDWRGVRALNIK